MMKKIQILFEDEDILVVVKPAGILSQGDQSNSPDMVSLIKGNLIIREKREGKKLSSDSYVAVIHRLDRMVRGIMVYAKSKRAAASLSLALQQGDFEKTYLAIVDRREKDNLRKSEDFNRLTSFIGYQKGKNLSFLSKEGRGDKCILDYKVLEITEKKAQLLIHLITGRKHQIRLQMTEISDGIRGDRKYHLNADRNEEGKVALALECICLSFSHPISKERLYFEIEPKVAVL